MKYPTQDELKEDFNYVDGHLIRKTITTNSVRVGEVAGCVNYRGYRHLDYRKTNSQIHRLIWIYVYGSIDPKLEVDHINGIKDDNRIENLRLVTHQQNAFNFRAKGYVWKESIKKYQAYIGHNYKKIYLGVYKTEEEAREAYLKAKKRYHKIPKHTMEETK